ncbi:MAG: DUF6262 family protein [Solirubrobacteraceae bacterium]
MAAEPLNQAAAARHQRTMERVKRALRDLDQEGAAVSFQAVARRAGVSRQWLYTQPGLRAEIERLRDQGPSRADGVPAGSARARRRCASAWRRSGRRTSGCARRTPTSRPSSRSPTALNVLRSDTEHRRLASPPAPALAARLDDPAHADTISSCAFATECVSLSPALLC